MVDPDVVLKTLPELPPVVQDMVRFQMLTGARPGEVCFMRTEEITFGTDGVWRFKPTAHKTKHRGKSRTIFIGPEAQRVVQVHLVKSDGFVCRHTKKGKPQNYLPPSYGKAILKPCERAFGMPSELRHLKKSDPAELRAKASAWRKANCWHPNQLRHLRATEVRTKYGLEAAQVILGHSHADVTQIYAETDEAAAVNIVREIG